MATQEVHAQVEYIQPILNQFLDIQDILKEQDLLAAAISLMALVINLMVDILQEIRLMAEASLDTNHMVVVIQLVVNRSVDFQPVVTRMVVIQVEDFQGEDFLVGDLQQED